MNDKPKELEEHSAQIFELGCMERPVYLKEDVDAVIAGLKQKLEDAKATAYAEMVDAGMENRRLKRALWLARAWGANQRTKYLDFFLTGRAHAIRKYKWIKITSKCRAKAEEYK